MYKHSNNEKHESNDEEHERKNVNDDGTEVNVQTEREEFKCMLCIFKTDKKDQFERHKKEIHSFQGKYFYTKCLENNSLDTSTCTVNVVQG